MGKCVRNLGNLSHSGTFSSDVASFFQPSIDCVVRNVQQLKPLKNFTVRQQIALATHLNSPLFIPLARCYRWGFCRERLALRERQHSAS